MNLSEAASHADRVASSIRRVVVVVPDIKSGDYALARPYEAFFARQTVLYRAKPGASMPPYFSNESLDAAAFRDAAARDAQDRILAIWHDLNAIRNALAGWIKPAIGALFAITALLVVLALFGE